MRKKITTVVSILLVAVMLCLVFSGCSGVDTSNTLKFANEEEMKTALKGTWIDEDHESILVMDGHCFKEYSYNDALLTAYCETRNKTVLTGIAGKPVYNYKRGCFDLSYDDGSPSNTVCVYSEDEISYTSQTNLGSITYTYFKYGAETKMPPQILYDKIKTYGDAVQAESEFNDKKEEYVPYSEFQYNPFGYVGEYTYIEGTAELDTYFNWGYEKLEAVCFCIKILPTGGSYSDTMYIYGRRDDFGDLFTELQGGTKKVCLFFNPWFNEGYKHNMGWLTDYYML